MTKEISMPKQIRINLLIDSIAFLGFILMALSGISFLLFPTNDTLNGLHAFGSVMTFAAIVAHIVLHWQWIKTMARRSVEFLVSRNVTLPKSVRFNVVIDTLIAISFLVTMVSGVLLDQRAENSESSNRESVGTLQSGLFENFMDDEPGNLSDGPMPGSATKPVFHWEALDLIHLGAVIALFDLLSIHIWIHGRWITNVTGRFIESLRQRSNLSGQSIKMETNGV